MVAENRICRAVPTAVQKLDGVGNMDECRSNLCSNRMASTRIVGEAQPTLAKTATAHISKSSRCLCTNDLSCGLSCDQVGNGGPWVALLPLVTTIRMS